MSFGDELPTFQWVLFEIAVFVLVEEVGFYYSHRYYFPYCLGACISDSEPMLVSRTGFLIPQLILASFIMTSSLSLSLFSIQVWDKNKQKKKLL